MSRLPQLWVIVAMIALALVQFLGGPVRAEDWPQWRGPQRDNLWVEAGVAKSFAADGLKIVWRAPIGPGYSSPVVARGRAFVTDSQLARPTARERIHCFDASNGKSLWTFGYDVNYPDWAFTQGPGSGPTATPIVSDGKIYALGAMGHLCCCAATNGKLLWERNLDKDYQVKEFSCRTSPLIESNLLILYIGGKPQATVIALDKDDGREVWKALNEPLTNSSPIVISAGARRQLIIWTEKSITSLDPATGQIYWREALSSDNNDAAATPVFHNDLLLAGGVMFRLDRQKPVASVLWPENKSKAARILSGTSTPLLRDGLVFSVDLSNLLVCVDAINGQRLWETDKLADAKSGASVHLTPNGDFVFIYNDAGQLILARLSRDSYHEIARAKLIEPTWPFAGRNVAWPPPAYADRCVFARNDQEIVCASLAAK